MRKLIAQWPFMYAGRSIEAGQTFEAIESDAALMLARGSVIERGPSVAESIRTTIQTVAKKRGYKRRDMNAEPPQ